MNLLEAWGMGHGAQIVERIAFVLKTALCKICE
jgi:hypothetical protein